LFCSFNSADLEQFYLEIINLFSYIPTEGSPGSKGTGVISLNFTTLSDLATEDEPDYQFYTEVRFRKFSRQKCAPEERLNLLAFNLFAQKKKSNGSMDPQFVLDTNSSAVHHRHFCFDHVISPNTGTVYTLI
jgi:hypothetical protein